MVGSAACSGDAGSSIQSLVDGDAGIIYVLLDGGFVYADGGVAYPNGGAPIGLPSAGSLTCQSLGWCTTYQASTNSNGNNNDNGGNGNGNGGHQGENNGGHGGKHGGNGSSHHLVLSGGAIPDGFYRLEEGSSNVNGYLFQGGQVLRVGNDMSNQLGTYSISGNQLSIQFNTACNATSTTATSATESFSYEVVGGGELLLSSSSSGNSSAELRYQQFNDLGDVCQEDGDFRCTSNTCICSVTTSSVLSTCNH